MLQSALACSCTAFNASWRGPIRFSHSGRDSPPALFCISLLRPTKKASWRDRLAASNAQICDGVGCPKTPELNDCRLLSRTFRSGMTGMHVSRSWGKQIRRYFTLDISSRIQLGINIDQQARVRTERIFYSASAF